MPRCGYECDRLGNYKNHLKRKNMCYALKSDVVPTIANVVVSHVVINITQNTGNHTHVNTTINNNTNNNNNNININNHIYVTQQAQHQPKMSFPYQNYDHLSDDFKRSVLDLARKPGDGFIEAVKRMLEVTYFHRSEPHNMNIVIPDTAQNVARVVGRDKKWTAMPADTAIHDMVCCQGDAIRNFPDDPGLEGTIPEAWVKTIDDRFETGDFERDNTLHTHAHSMAGKCTSIMHEFLRVKDVLDQIAMANIEKRPPPPPRPPPAIPYDEQQMLNRVIDYVIHGSPMQTRAAPDRP